MESAKTFCCDKCKKTFSNYHNLKKHIKKFHHDKLSELLPERKKIQKQYKYNCEHCEKNFNHLHHLTYHKKKIHGISSIVEPKYKCELCGKNFNNLKQFNIHKKIHISSSSLESNNKRGKKKCPMCNFYTMFKKILLKHFTEAHDIEIETEYKEFLTLENFKEWKSDMEQNTKSKFVTDCSQRTRKKYSTLHFACHRSGNYICKGKGLRRLKTQGSDKINAFCPASLKVILEPDKCQVIFVRTHVGHQNDIDHLFLTDDDRNMLANKIASKIPFDVILDEVRGSVSNCELNRIHLLTKKDLFNIEQTFNLQSEAVRHKNDGISVEAWRVTDDNEKITKSRVILSELSERNGEEMKNQSLNEKKEKIKAHFADIVGSIIYEEEFEALEKLLVPIQPTLSAVKTNIENVTKSSLVLKPHNKKFLLQRRLFPTKMTITKISSRIQKTTVEEADEKVPMENNRMGNTEIH